MSCLEAPNILFRLLLCGKQMQGILSVRIVLDSSLLMAFIRLNMVSCRWGRFIYFLAFLTLRSLKLSFYFRSAYCQSCPNTTWYHAPLYLMSLALECNYV